MQIREGDQVKSWHASDYQGTVGSTSQGSLSAPSSTLDMKTVTMRRRRRMPSIAMAFVVDSRKKNEGEGPTMILDIRLLGDLDGMRSCPC